MELFSLIHGKYLDPSWRLQEMVEPITCSNMEKKILFPMILKCFIRYADQGILKWEEISVDSDRVDINYERLIECFRRLGGVGLWNMATRIRNPSGFRSGCSSEFSAGWWSLCQRPRIPRGTLLIISGQPYFA